MKRSIESNQVTVSIKGKKKEERSFIHGRFVPQFSARAHMNITITHCTQLNTL